MHGSRLIAGLTAGAVALGCALRAVGQAEPARYVPNDPLFPKQWPLDNRGQSGGAYDADVDAPEAWAITRGAPEVVIAIIDDGVELEHPDIAPNLLDRGRSFTRDGAAPDGAARGSADRHGTAVAGVAAARGDDGIGITGICPLCSILPIRVVPGANDGVAAAFRYALERGADIVTSSWGYALASAGDDGAVRAAIEAAEREGRGGRGAVAVFGVTNDVVDNCDGATRDVAALSSVVAVGVSDHRDRIGFSGFGSCLDLVAPSRPRAFAAGGVPTTDRLGLAGYVDGDYQAGFGGTSAAAPLVAGIAGLLLSLNPELEAADVRRLLVFTAEKIDASVARYDASGFSPTAGFGRINAARAVVPTVTLTVSPERAAVGEPVTVTLAASAPFGLAAVEWWGSAAPLPSAHTPAERALSGDVTATVTWSVVFDRPGRYELWADARDERSATPRPGYPHRAREAAGVAAASVVATERRRGESR